MCDKDFLFCTFYYLGYIAIGIFFSAGIYIFFDWIKERES